MFIFFLALIANVCEKYFLLIAAKKKTTQKYPIFLLLCKYIDSISQIWNEKEIPAD